MTGEDELIGGNVVSQPIYRLVAEYAPDYGRVLAVGIVLSIVGPVVGLLPPYILQTAIDSTLLQDEPFSLFGIPESVLPEDRVLQLYIIVGALVLITVISAGITYVAGWVWGYLSQELQHRIRVDTYTDAQALNLSVFENEQTGQMMSILNDDVRELSGLFNEFIGEVVTYAAMIIGISVFLLILHWEFALLSFVFIPALLIVTRYFVIRLKPKYVQVRQRIGGVNSRLENNLSGMHVIKSYSQESKESDRVDSESRSLYDKIWEVIQLRIKYDPTVQLLDTGGFALLLLVGGLWIIDGPPLFFSRSLSAGTLVAFLLYHNRLSEPIKESAQLIDKYYEKRAAALRVCSIREHDDELRVGEETISLDRLDGDVRFENVSYAYDDKEPVLRDVDFEVERGSLVGIVGSTGSGKSTLLKLLLRFYDPDHGTVRIDGHDLRDVDPSELRRHIGIVHQDTYLFAGTVRENIAYGHVSDDHRDDTADGLSDRAIEEAARLANAHEFIQDLPDGYGTNIGEEGMKLSGGQRQRVALARALVGDPDILVLDEATSHVDNKTELLIQQSLSKVVQGRTTFVVAHRLSTIRNADVILVLGEGEVAERGTHEELLEEGGRYAELWDIHVGNVTQQTQTASD